MGIIYQNCPNCSAKLYDTSNFCGECGFNYSKAAMPRRSDFTGPPGKLNVAIQLLWLDVVVIFLKIGFDIMNRGIPVREIFSALITLLVVYKVAEALRNKSQPARWITIVYMIFIISSGFSSLIDYTALATQVYAFYLLISSVIIAIFLFSQEVNDYFTVQY